MITFDLFFKDMKLKPNLNLGRLNQCKLKYEKNVVNILQEKNSALHCGSLLLLLKKMSHGALGKCLSLSPSLFFCSKKYELKSENMNLKSESLWNIYKSSLMFLIIISET